MTAYWKICFDDSCDEKRERYVCAGSLIGTKEAWNRFNKQWRKALGSTPSIAYFHGKEGHRLTGQFAQFRDTVMHPWPAGRNAATAKRKEMQRVIEQSHLVGFGVGVFVPVYRKIRDSHPRGKTFMAEDPFEYILQELIFRTTKEIADAAGLIKVSFVFDRSNRSAIYERVFAEWKKWNPNTARSMLGISHQDDEQNYGLQAADLAATAVNLLFRSHMKAGEIPRQYALSNRFWRVWLINEKHLLTVLDHQTPRESEAGATCRRTGPETSGIAIGQRRVNLHPTFDDWESPQKSEF